MLEEFVAVVLDDEYIIVFFNLNFLGCLLSIFT